MTNQQNLLQTNESRLTTAIIGVLLIIGGFMIYSFSRGGGDEVIVEPEGTVSAESAEVSSTESELSASLESVESASSESTPSVDNTYIVQPGDNLWKIAAAKLGDGFAWKELAQVNNIPVDNPVIDIGQELIVSGFGGPEDGAGDVLSALSAEVNEEGDTVSTEKYTVQKGDTLWSIAQKFYGNGGQWKRIFDASENELSLYTSSSGQTYPLIHAGNVLIIP